MKFRVIGTLMDFLYLQRKVDHSVKYCIIIMVHAYNACAVLCLLYVNPLEKSPPPPPTRYRSTIVLLLYTSSIFKDTLYFLLKYVLPPVLFTLTQVVLLLITSTFTRVQIQSNLGTTALFHWFRQTEGLFQSLPRRFS